MSKEDCPIMSKKRVSLGPFPGIQEVGWDAPLPEPVPLANFAGLKKHMEEIGTSTDEADEPIIKDAP